MIEAVNEGQTGFCGGWISSYHLRQLIDSRRIRMSPNQMHDLLEQMGYMHHPALIRGRSIVRLPCDDNQKSTLYVASGAWKLHGITDPKAACADYVNTQTQKIAATFAMTGTMV